MLRTNRKNSPISNGGSSSAALLPTFYDGSNGGQPQEPAATSSSSSSSFSLPSTPSIPFPTLVRRKRRAPKSTGSSRRSKNSANNTVALILCGLCCTCLGGYFVVAQHRQRQRPLNSLQTQQPQINTLADPPLTTLDHPADTAVASQLLYDADGESHLQRRAAEAHAQHNSPPKQIMLAPKAPRPSDGLYDVVVVGAGPAGLTAALFAARAGLSVIVFGSDASSQLAETHLLQNYPSFMWDKGPLWLDTTKQQAAQWGATFAQAGLLLQSMVVQVQAETSTTNEYENNRQQQQQQSATFALQVNNNNNGQPSKKDLQVHARSVIVATGATGRRLGLPLEDDLWGRSVHSCAVCDGSSYVDKTVVVVGGGDAAIDGALLLARYAKEVIVVHRRADFRASNQRNMDLLRYTPNIRVEVPFVIKTFETFTSKLKYAATNDGGGKVLEQQVLAAVELEDVDTKTVQRIPCDGVFELIGSTPNTDWLKASSLSAGDESNNSKNAPQLDKGGFLDLSNDNRDTRTATTLDGVFAAGEVTDQIYRQAITAAAEGAQAAMDAERWLRTHPAPSSSSSNQQGEADQAVIPLQTVLVPDKKTEAQVPSEAPPHPVLPKDPTDQIRQEQDDKDDSACDLTQEDCIIKIVHQYPVVVFSKPWCPFCRKALEAFSAEGLPEGHENLHVVDLSLLGQKTHQVQAMLQEMTGRRTVPNVFVGGTSIGGGDETNKFHREGALRARLIEAKAIPGESVAVNEGQQQQGETDQVAGHDDPCDDLTQEPCITRLVKQYPVVVFSKQGCPHCRRALEALALDGLPLDSPHLYIVNLTPMVNRQLIQDQLESMTGRRTVPNVFLGGTSIGGGSETVQLQHGGGLRTMLEKAHAIEETQ